MYDDYDHDEVPTPRGARETFSERLSEAGLDTKRFIDVDDGEKGSHDHTQLEPDDARLSGNYGVYGGGGLIDVDVDDYRDNAASAGLEAVNGLPDTFTVQSPHTDGEDGGHRYYRVVAGDGYENAEGASKAATDASNPDLSWGEVRVKNQYVVGPGSQLDDCTKEWCDECANPEGGYYRIADDRSIATITADEFYQVLAADPQAASDEDHDGDTRARDYDDVPTPDVAGDAPDDLPECYLQALKGRVHVPEKAPHAHAINRDAAILAIYSGYSVDDAVEHFREYPLRGDPGTFDEGTTRSALRGTAEKIENGDLHPPSVEKLRGLGVLDDGDECDCRIHGDGEDEYDRDPRELDVVLDHRDAWEAARRVTPADLDTPIDGSAVTADGDTWRADGGQVDVVRAVAVADHDHAPDDALDAAAYDRAYRVARERYGAPLPEYVTEADAADRYDAVLAAVRALDFSRLDKTAFDATIREADARAGNDVTHFVDPTPVDGWRDSESGRSVLVFDGRTVWDAETETTVDALRLVALDAGLIDSPTADLKGDTFERAYRLTRDDYGAPLPRWAVDTPEDVEAFLPPADQLTNDDTPRVGDTVNDARDDVESLYRDLVTERRGEGRGASVLTALPALGKTTSAIKTAADRPTTYLAPRKELQEDTVEKAEKYDVTYCVLPVFGGGERSEGAVREGVQAVRDADQDLLRNRWALADHVDEPLFEDDGDSDTKDVDLDRPTCSTAEGEHGVAWALAFHVARALDYTPRDIHERAEALFGGPPPCTENGECEYSRGWDDIADRDNPADLLIGSYQHAYVESARTHYSRDATGATKRRPRAVVLDEYPGEAFDQDYGSEFVEHARWLASALREDVADRSDFFDANLWGDDWVRAWLTGTAADDGHTDAIVRALREAAGTVRAIATADDVLDTHPDWCEAHDLTGVLEAVRDTAATLTPSEAGDYATTIREATAAVPDQEGASIARWIEADIVEPLDNYDGPAPGDVVPDHLTGELRAFVEDALDAYTAGREDAAGLLDAAATALEGGPEGCRELAVHGDDGYAHRDAHLLLRGLITPTENARADVVTTDDFAYGDRDGDGTRVNAIRVPRDDGVTDTVLVDRNHDGATIRSPPARTAGGGDECPVVGLDATGRRELWREVLGVDVDVVDIHDTPTERAQFAKDVLGLQVVQIGHEMRYYEGDPASKDLDGDVAALEEMYDKYAGIHGPHDRDVVPATVGGPATITSKGVRNVLEADPRLDGIVPAWDNYGNVTGDNSLGGHTLGAILGCQHFGDAVVEKFAALAGEEVHRTGHGTELDYDSDVANAYLKHMTDDQTMQAILRFTRGDSGATVFARTAALRDDLPVVGEGQVVRSWSETGATVAQAWKRTVRRGERFTVADVADSVDVTTRQVRRVLDEFADAGYLTKHDTPNGVANQFTVDGTPSAGETELPQVNVDPDASRKDVYYTGNVRVCGVEDGPPSAFGVSRSVVPSPDAVDAGAPPG